MPIFHLNLADGVYVPDVEGHEFASLHAARDQAVECAREIMSKDVRKGHLDLTEQFVITGGSGHQLAVLNFRDAVKIRRVRPSA
jgi:hypothetical protein